MVARWRPSKQELDMNGDERDEEYFIDQVTRYHASDTDPLIFNICHGQHFNTARDALTQEIDRLRKEKVSPALKAFSLTWIAVL